MELMLQVDISGFFNYNSELVRRKRERGNTLLSLPAKRVNLDLADLLLLLCCSMFVCFALPRLFHALFCCLQRAERTPRICCQLWTGLPGGQQVAISKGVDVLRVLGLRGPAQAAQDGHEGHQVPQDDAALARAAEQQEDGDQRPRGAGQIILWLPEFSVCSLAWFSSPCSACLLFQNARTAGGSVDRRVC